MTTQRHTVIAPIRRATHGSIHGYMDSLIGRLSHSFVGGLQQTFGTTVLLLVQDIPSFEKIVEVLRAMVACEMTLCCPCTPTFSRVAPREQRKYLVALRGENRQRRSAASHVELAWPLIIYTPRERQHHQHIEPRFHGEGYTTTGLGCYIEL